MTERDVVIFDIEASCEDRKINSQYNMETIEIGAVKVRDGEIIDTFETFVKPEYTEKLTPFCTELTGITYEDLKDAPIFKKAILDFYDFIYGCDIFSCGDFDRKFLVRELESKGFNYKHELAINAINSSHEDLKKYYNRITEKKKKGMIGMMEELEIPMEGDHHRALSDSLNLTKIYLKLEKIREEKLRKVFKGKTLDKLIDSINHHHDESIKKINENLFECSNSQKETQKHKSFIKFIDYWSQVIIVDIEIIGLNYIDDKKLKKLKQLTNI